eukprot:5547055-Pyramimonas_sp.AAC.1
MHELCGGTGGAQQSAFKRKLTSGGHLGNSTNVDLGNSQVQQAVDHHLHARFVAIVILQLGSRTTRLPSYFLPKQL